MDMMSIAASGWHLWMFDNTADGFGSISVERRFALPNQLVGYLLDKTQAKFSQYSNNVIALNKAVTMKNVDNCERKIVNTE